jgi:hypothetical protein
MLQRLRRAINRLKPEGTYLAAEVWILVSLLGILTLVEAPLGPVERTHYAYALLCLVGGGGVVVVCIDATFFFPRRLKKYIGRSEGAPPA